MNETQINTIRDAALYIKDTSPSLAFDLISIARNYRSNGPLINEVYNNLKSDLGIIDILLIGNCQIIALANLFKFKTSKIRVTKFVVHEDKVSEQLLSKEVAKSDFVISQKISSNFKSLSTEKLQEIAGEKLILIHNLYYLGYHPDWCYLPLINGIRLKSPIGDYHNKTVLDGFINNLTIDEIKGNINSESFNSRYYNGLADTSILELEKRENDIDIKMVETLKERISTSSKALFHTFNHPSKLLLNDEANKIFERIGVKEYNKGFVGDCLDDVQLPVNLLNGRVELTPLLKNGSVVNIDDFIVDSLEIYTKNTSYVDLYLDINKLR